MKIDKITANQMIIICQYMKLIGKHYLYELRPIDVSLALELAAASKKAM